MKKDFSKSLQKKNNKSFIINKEIVENYIIAPSTTKNASLENNSNRRNNKSKVRLSFNITSEMKKNSKKIPDYKNWTADKFLSKNNNKISLYYKCFEQINYIIEN